MPIYEYRCDVCGHTVEVFQKFSDDPLETCEVCGGHLSKVLHPVAIHFKGSGFYTTDYGRGSSKARPAGEPTKAADETDESDHQRRRRGRQGGRRRRRHEERRSERRRRRRRLALLEQRQDRVARPGEGNPMQAHDDEGGDRAAHRASASRVRRAPTCATW